MLQLHSGDLATYLDNLESNIWLKNTIIIYCICY
jgi:hypothetical protein